MLKFGRLAPKFHPKTLKLDKYILKNALPIPPEKAYWEYALADNQWGMFGNDQYGDCTVATIAHMIMCWTKHTRETMVIPTLEQVLSFYSAVSGFDPQTGNNDNGAAITDVMARWQEVGLNDDKIDGWVSIDYTNIEHVKLGVYLFGGVNPGINVPQSAMDQFNAGMPWEQSDSTIVGGHSIPVLGYGSQGCTCITWAKRQPMSWAFFQDYTEELYAAISLDWIDKQGVAPNHIDLNVLRADLAALKQ